jgi:hypothetical protein
MKLEQVPKLTSYEEGGHCLFYALQAANEYFNGGGLSSGSREWIKKRNSRLEQLYRSITNSDEVRGGTLATSLAEIVPKLHELGIVPNTVVCTAPVVEELQSHAVIRNLHMTYRLADETEAEFPILVFNYRPDETPHGHVWFAGSDEEYNVGKEMEERPQDKTIMIMSLKKI